MRTVYWALFGVSLALMLLGLFVIPVPDHADIEAEILQDWFTAQTVYGLLLGMAVGLVGAFSVVKWLMIRTTDDASGFSFRAQMCGIVTAVAALGGAAVLSLWMGASNDAFEPLSGMARMKLIANSLNFVGVLGASVASSLLAFAAYARMKAWGGTYSLVPR